MSELPSIVLALSGATSWTYNYFIEVLRKYCGQSMDKLEAGLTAFPKLRDPSGIHSACVDFRLLADSLALDFETALVLEGEMSEQSRRAIAHLLQRAVDSIPGNEDPRLVEHIQSQMSHILLARSDEE